MEMKENATDGSFSRYNHKGETPVPPWHPGTLNDGPTIAVGTEVGVLSAITGHCPTPLEGGTSRHRSGGNSTHTIIVPLRRSENPLTYPLASQSGTRDDSRGIAHKMT
ncbi:hypothetical protein AVEN_123798-1 [Araneus ventricosus]|uniref:Uncharacterized protein n=1 Tax=Araneus ventricosus TaxID=182803 RepID=A0A4Y2BLP4_ARAVE|nr:hypothetical protein AVEN_123798-1 [Araneus ventricosus]